MDLLEAADYNDIDQLFLFFAWIIDTCYWNSTSALVIDAFPAYVDFMNRIYRRS